MPHEEHGLEHVDFHIGPKREFRVINEKSLEGELDWDDENPESRACLIQYGPSSYNVMIVNDTLPKDHPTKELYVSGRPLSLSEAQRRYDSLSENPFQG